MATAIEPQPGTATEIGPPPTVADLLARLGDIPPDRVRLHPAPGLATEADVDLPGAKLCELVDGCLVEKAMGYVEAFLALALGGYLRAFVKPRKLGVVVGPDGFLRLSAGLVRAPDLSFIPWSRFPGGRLPEARVPSLAPDLAVEILSRGNTRREIDRKVAEYLAAGTRLIWLIDPATRTARMIGPAAEPTPLDASGTLDGGVVLPGFRLSLAELFAELNEGTDA